VRALLFYVLCKTVPGTQNEGCEVFLMKISIINLFKIFERQCSENRARYGNGIFNILKKYIDLLREIIYHENIKTGQTRFD